jgi:hypothetical protein
VKVKAAGINVKIFYTEVENTAASGIAVRLKN